MSNKEIDVDRGVRIVQFLKAVGINPQRKIEDVGADFQIPRSSAHHYITRFAQDYAYLAPDPDFPRRLLAAYNNDLPAGADQLNATDVEQLMHLVDEFYARNLPPEEPQSINIQENTSRTLYSTPGDPTRDNTTDEGYLRNLLLNAKYVNEATIQRFIQQYSMNKEVFDRNPMAFLDYMKYFFGPQQGENIFKLWQSGRGKHVYGADQQQQNGMDPMMLYMMMSGGQMNPLMMSMMQNGNGGAQNPMMGYLMSQMAQTQQRESEKRFQQEQFDRMMNMMMMRFATAAVDDKKPWMDQMGGMGMSPMGYSIQEYPDESGKIKYRAYVPNFPGMGNGMQPHTDPIITAILQGQMQQNTALLSKLADSGNQPTSILNTLLPHFLPRSNVGQDLANMIDTMNKVSPGFFDRKNEPTPNLEIMKMKFDTDLALNASRIEQIKLEHNLRMDEEDRRSANNNAQKWLDTFGNVGDKIVTTIAPAIAEGIGGFGGGMLNKKSQQQQQMSQQQAQIQQQQMMAARQRQEEQLRQQQMQQAQQMQQSVQPQSQAQSQDPGMVYYVTMLQQQLNQSENNNKILLQKLQELEAQPRTQQGFDIDEKRLGRMSTGQLQTLLQELAMQTNSESRLKDIVTAEIHNRQIIGREPNQNAPQEEIGAPTDTSVERQFNTGEEQPEPAPESKNEENAT